MVISTRGLDLIKEHEALRLNAYLDIAGIPTIGWGHTRGVSMGMTITLSEAENFIRDDTAEAVKAVNDLVKVPLNQNQFDALVDLVFNIGTHHFATSTLLRLLNTKNYADASLQFARWNLARNPKTGVLEESAGLTKRREEEKQLFLEGMA